MNSLLLLNDFSVICVKRKLVMTTRGWTTRILKEDFDIDMNADVQMVAWGHFELLDDETNMPQWFCFRDGSHTNIPMSESHHGLYYGFPAIPSHGKSRTSRIVKGTDFTPDCAYMGSIVPKKNKREVHEELREDIQSFVRSHWPILSDMLDLQYSPYHVTPSQDFVLGHLPGLQHVLLFCRGSGRAFKFAPLLGTCLSDLVHGKSARIDISRFEPRKAIQTSPKKLGRMATEVKRTDRKVLEKLHGPFGEKGRGVYSLVTQGCFDVFNRFQSLIAKDFEKSIPYEPLAGIQRLPVTLYDFGAADGGTSLQLWTDIIRKCMELCPDHEIEMKYEDQPNADYQSLFYYTQGLFQVPGRTVETYLQSEFADKVFVSAVGTSFHQQCLPSKTLSFGFSATAMHWLSRCPDIALPSGVLYHTQLHESDETVGAWARVAAEDWERILMARAAELKSGGRMVIISLCADEYGQSLGNTTAVPRSMFDEMAHHWRTMMVGGLISKEECDRMEVVNYYRSLKEMTSVLLDESSEVY